MDYYYVDITIQYRLYLEETFESMQDLQVVLVLVYLYSTYFLYNPTAMFLLR